MKIKRVKLLNYGRLIPGTEEKEVNADSVTGYYLYPSVIWFVEQSTVFKGQVGLKFGIEYRIEGNQDSNDAIFYCKISHPPIINSVTKKRATTTTERKVSRLNSTNFDYYSFEYDWEVQAGIWVFQLLESERIILRQEFFIQ